MARLQAVGKSRVQILVGTRDVPLLSNIRRGSGLIQPFLGVKLLVCEVDYSHLMLTSGMNGAILLLPPYAFMSWTGANLLYDHD
jgi:hypothetical protein